MKNRKMLKSLRGIGLALLAVILLAVGCAAPEGAPAPAPAPEPEPEEELPQEEALPEIEIKFSTWASSESLFFQIVEEPLCRRIEEAVPRAKVTEYPASSLIALKDNYVGTMEGTVDLTSVFTMVIPGVIPLMDIVLLPGLFTNTTISMEVLWELHRLYPCFEEQFDPKLKYMLSTPTTGCHINSSMPIRTLAEMEGKVITSDSALGLRALELMGASPVHMTGFESYTAAERGVIDGSLNGFDTVGATKLYEQFHYHTLVGLCPVVACWVFCRDTWDKFTPEEQLRLELVFKDFAFMYTARLLDTAVFGYEECTKPGQEIITWSTADMDKMKELLRPVWNEWAEDMEELGYPGKAILDDAIRLIETHTAM